jgi:hypothetical protein
VRGEVTRASTEYLTKHYADALAKRWVGRMNVEQALKYQPPTTSVVFPFAENLHPFVGGAHRQTVALGETDGANRIVRSICPGLLG